MKIERFEDIEAWREARKLVNLIYDFTDGPEFCKDYELKNDIRRAAISVMSNISEGFDRGSNKDFIRFLIIGRASVSEVKSQLYIALDRSYISRNQFEAGHEQGTKIASLINGFIRHLGNSERRE